MSQSVVLVVVCVFVVVIAEQLLWPVRRCRLCAGRGELRSPFTRSMRPCRCDGGWTTRWLARLVHTLFGGRR